MDTSSINDFINSRRGKPWRFKLKIKEEPLAEEWSQWLICPTPGYLEAAEQGPYSMRKIEWIDINPVEFRKPGRLMPVKEIDHSAEIIKMLNDTGIQFSLTEGIIRIPLTVLIK